jgi:hypothetical protein
LLGAEEDDQDESIDPSAAADALKDFVAPTAEKNDQVKDEEGGDLEEKNKKKKQEAPN